MHKMLSFDEDCLLRGVPSQQKFIVTQESGRDTTLSAFEPVLPRIVDGVSNQRTSVQSY